MQLVFLFLSTICQPQTAEIDPECLAFVRSDVVPAWREHERQFEDFDVRCVFEAFELQGRGKKSSKLRRERRFVVAKGGRLRLLESPGDGIVTVYTTNQRYGFQVRGSLDRSGFSLHELTPAPLLRSGKRKGVLTSLSLTDVFSQIGYEFFRVPLSDLVEDRSADFELVEARYIQTGDERHVRIAARYQGPNERYRWSDGTYWAEFPDEPPFLAVRSGVESPGVAFDELFTITYHENASSPPALPKLVTRVSGDLDLGTLQIYSFEVAVPCDLEDDAFFLPHYGISEEVLETLDPVSHRWRNVFLALLPVAFLFLIAVWRSKRNQSSPRM
jgi:hypothetical protein